MLDQVDRPKPSLFTKELVLPDPRPGVEDKLLYLYPYGATIPIQRWLRDCRASDRIITLESGLDPIVVLGAPMHGAAIEALRLKGYSSTAEYRMHLVLDDSKVLNRMYCLENGNFPIIPLEIFAQNILSIIPPSHIAWRPWIAFNGYSKVIGSDIITANSLTEADVKRMKESSKIDVLQVYQRPDEVFYRAHCRIRDFPEVLRKEFGCRPSKRR